MVGSFLEAAGNWEWKGKERDPKLTFPFLIELTIRGFIKLSISCVCSGRAQWPKSIKKCVAQFHGRCGTALPHVLKSLLETVHGQQPAAFPRLLSPVPLSANTGTELGDV